MQILDYTNIFTRATVGHFHRPTLFIPEVLNTLWTSKPASGIQIHPSGFLNLSACNLKSVLSRYLRQITYHLGFDLLSYLLLLS